MIKLDKELVQWDTGVTITIESDTPVNEVHFHTDYSDTALVVSVKDDKTADIPNILLQSNLPFTAWLVIYDGINRKSVESQTFKITSRVRPDDYIYTETEVRTFDGLVENVNEAVNNANAVAMDLIDKRDSGYFNGADGAPGEKGETGRDGYTPKKSVDYWTESDIAEIHGYIDKQLGVIENGSY